MLNLYLKTLMKSLVSPNTSSVNLLLFLREFLTKGKGTSKSNIQIHYLLSQGTEYKALKWRGKEIHIFFPFPFYKYRLPHDFTPTMRSCMNNDVYSVVALKKGSVLKACHCAFNRTQSRLIRKAHLELSKTFMSLGC